MITALHTTILFFALVAAPALWLASVAYVRRFEGVQLSWKQTDLVYVTLGAFVVVLSSFLVGCFFLAAYLGRLQGIALLENRADDLLTLAVDCFLVMLGTAITFFALRNLFTQFITREGIYLTRMPAALWQGRHHLDSSLLRWQSIKDYYQHSDYPVTKYRFIAQGPTGAYERHELAVPFYVLPRFEALLELTLQKEQELRAQGKPLSRRASR